SPISTLFPYTTLFRSYRRHYISARVPSRLWGVGSESRRMRIAVRPSSGTEIKPPRRHDRWDSRTRESGTHSEVFQGAPRGAALADRKSTRLNSSHVAI